MVRPGSLVRVLLVVTLIASGVAYAQNQVKPNQVQVFIAAVDASGGR